VFRQSLQGLQQIAQSMSEEKNFYATRPESFEQFSSRDFVVKLRMAKIFLIASGPNLLAGRVYPV